MTSPHDDRDNARTAGLDTEPEHPLVALFADLARGNFPPADGRTAAMPAPTGAAAAVLAFTAHCVVAADVDPAWIAAQCPDGELSRAFSPDFLSALAAHTRAQPGAHDLVLAASGLPDDDGDESAEPLSRISGPDEHPRAQRAYRMRSDVRVYRSADGSGLLAVGRGLAGRWEAGFEVAPDARNRGTGRRLARAARHLIGPGETLFLQVAVGNVASLRASLAAGFIPVGGEMLFTRL